MTCTSIASNPTDRVDSDLTASNTPIVNDAPQILKFSKISIAALILAVFGAAFLQNVLWMPASHPAEVPCAHKQAVAK
jgi:hypothetical protein